MRMNEVQNWFKKGVLELDIDLQELPGLTALAGIPLAEGMEVYQDIYYSKLISALGKNFEAVMWVVGHEKFQELCLRYIDAHPPVSFKLSDYGSAFSDFLSQCTQVSGLPYLPDLACFEWQIKEIQNAATAAPVSIEEIQNAIHEANFRVTFVEAMSVFQSMYSVVEIWRRRKEPRNTYEEVNWNQPQSLLIFKKGQTIQVEVIDPTHAEVLRDLRDGKNISQALAGFSEVISPADNARLFQTMMRAGIIDDIIPL